MGISLFGSPVMSNAVPQVVSATPGAAGVGAQAARDDHSHQLQDSGWIIPTLLNGWVNYDPTNYARAGYRKIGEIVYLTGLVRSGTVGADIFILPVGYRPTRNLHLSVPSNGVHGIVEIRSMAGTAGSVYANTGSNVWFSLDCSFATGGT